MKKNYTKPEFEVKDFARFENVFTVCDRDMAKGKSSSNKGFCTQGKQSKKGQNSNFGEVPGS